MEYCIFHVAKTLDSTGYYKNARVYKGTSNGLLNHSIFCEDGFDEKTLWNQWVSNDSVNFWGPLAFSRKFFDVFWRRNFSEIFLKRSRGNFQKNFSALPTDRRVYSQFPRPQPYVGDNVCRPTGNFPWYTAKFPDRNLMAGNILLSREGAVTNLKYHRFRQNKGRVIGPPPFSTTKNHRC